MNDNQCLLQGDLHKHTHIYIYVYTHIYIDTHTHIYLGVLPHPLGIDHMFHFLTAIMGQLEPVESALPTKVIARNTHNPLQSR